MVKYFYMRFRSAEGFNPSPERQQNNNLDLAYQKAVKVLDLDTVNPQDFIEVYGEDVVKSDLAEVERLKGKFETKKDGPSVEIQKLAKILEAIIHHQIEVNDWFGPNVNTIKPTEYDDFINKIDEIVEFEEADSATYMGLAIDATTSADTTKKLKQIKSEIERGQLPKIKYFESAHLHIKGQKANLPRVVVEIHPSTIRKLMELWVGGKNKQLAEHPVQLQILNQILMQLAAFETLAMTIGRTEIADIYSKAKNKVSAVIASKDLLHKTLDYAAVDIDDGSSFNLKEEMKRVFTELEF
ncbi:MAG: hypothetical protein NVSMB66_1300 [Candidatus Doudnabacteria bacterium]